MNGQPQNAWFLFSFVSEMYLGLRHLFKMSFQLSTPAEDFKQRLKKEQHKQISRDKINHCASVGFFPFY